MDGVGSETPLGAGKASMSLLAPRSLSRQMSGLMDICGLLRWCGSLPGTCAGGIAVATSREGDGAAQQCCWCLTQQPFPALYVCFAEPGTEKPRAAL